MYGFLNQIIIYFFFLLPCAVPECDENRKFSRRFLYTYDEVMLQYLLSDFSSSSHSLFHEFMLPWWPSDIIHFTGNLLSSGGGMALTFPFVPHSPKGWLATDDILTRWHFSYNNFSMVMYYTYIYLKNWIHVYLSYPSISLGSIGSLVTCQKYRFFFLRRVCLSIQKKKT